MRLPFLVVALVPVVSLAASPGASAPAPLAPPASIAKPSPTVAQFLEKLPGAWSGEQRMISPKKQVMTIRVSETYRWETDKSGARVLVGELTYSMGSGDKAKTFRGHSRTRALLNGRGVAEVEQDGKVLRYEAEVREDTLVFVPEGSGDKPKSATGVCVRTEGDARFMQVKGFQTGPDGLYLVEGRLLFSR